MEQHSFTFEGRDGYVYEDGTVSWGGLNFQIEAARPDLRAAIAKAKFAKLMNMTETLDMLKRLGKK